MVDGVLVCGKFIDKDCRIKKQILPLLFLLSLLLIFFLPLTIDDEQSADSRPRAI